MEHPPQRTLEYAQGTLDKYIAWAERALCEEHFPPSRIRLTRERLPLYFDLAVENGEDINDAKIAHIGDLINKLSAIDVEALIEKLRTAGRK